MLYIFIAFIIICLINVKFSKNGFEDYMQKEQTTAIKGIFAIIIFFSHFNSYVQLSGIGQEKIYVRIISGIGQLMVAIFLFYSGYGIYCSANKKENYIKHFPKNRILKTLLNFDVAVLLFLILDLIMGIKYGKKDILLSFTAWTSIGNSNWFIFAILAMYIITYAVARINKCKVHLSSIIVITIIIIIYIILMRFVKPGYWYDTVLCYSLGLWYGLYKEKIDNLFKSKYIYILISTIVIFVILYMLKARLIIYEALAMVFCLLITIITYKVKISNKILAFLGKYSFEIYILQRLPDIVLKKYLADKIYIYFVTSLACTLIIAVMYKKILDIVNKKLINE